MKSFYRSKPSKLNEICLVKKNRGRIIMYSYMCYFMHIIFSQYPVLQPHLIVYCLLTSDSRRRAMVAAVQLQDWHLVWHLHQFRWESCFLSCVVDLFDSHMFRDTEKASETVLVFHLGYLLECWIALIFSSLKHLMNPSSFSYVTSSTLCYYLTCLMVPFSLQDQVLCSLVGYIMYHDCVRAPCTLLLGHSRDAFNILQIWELTV